MNAKYYSGWTHEDDMELVECVLRNVRQGKTVVNGCEEYEEMTNGKRSADASKYRFHTQLKAKYSEAYELARKQGRETKKESKEQPIQARLEKVNNFIEHPNEEQKLTIDDVILVFNQFKKQSGNTDELEKVKKENERLKKENIKLGIEMKEMEKTLEMNLKQQNKILGALKILESAGININIPETKYVVNKDGTIEKH